MASVNKWIGIGNLGRDPEMRYAPNGDAVTNISIACTHSWKNKDGEKQEETEWVRVVFFGRLAEVAGKYLKKGAPCYVEGRLQTKKWKDKEGVERYSTQVVAERLQLLGNKSDSERERGDGAPPEPRPRNSAHSAAPAKKPAGKFDDMEDDIPF